MCGIVGVWGGGRDWLDRLMKGLDLLKHRGPDGWGFHLDRRFVLGHRRLSVVGGPRGRQPLHNEDGSLAVVYNGEIYNHGRLRGLLRGRHRLGSKSDGEVLAHLYEDEGPAMVPFLQGMFALAVAERDGLLLARDPLGVKPLYWSRQGGPICFASEMKALLPLCDASSVEVFPPGHYFTPGQGLQRYYARADDTVGPGEDSFWCGRLLRELERSVRQRLMSDGPVGVFLSGGLDSSLIAALAARNLREPLKTFAVGLPGSPDLRQAALVARHLGTQHHEVTLEPDRVLRELPRILHHLESYDPDLVASAIPCYYLSELASRHVKVVLTGEGADELFAGYRYHRDYRSAPERLHQELERSLDNLHHINLQRVDRMSMAHGLEARVPFLGACMVRLALRIPTELKLRGARDKYILRRAAERHLPDEVAWREKSQFDEGSGARQLLNSLVSPGRFQDEFYRLFPRELERLVVRWSSGRISVN